MRIAIMQPYFLPYAGYFRLFNVADLVVMLDCVQFPRRGWIHRNRLPNWQHQMQWLTIPLQKTPRDTFVHQLKLSRDYKDRWYTQLLRFPAAQVDDPLSKMVADLRGDPIDYIINILGVSCKRLGFSYNVLRSHTLNIPKNLRGQHRIIAIAKHFGATEYINLAGGRELYSHELFEENNIKLHFLTPYVGDYSSIWHRLVSNDSDVLRKEIEEQTVLSAEPAEEPMIPD